MQRAFGFICHRQGGPQKAISSTCGSHRPGARAVRCSVPGGRARLRVHSSGRPYLTGSTFSIFTPNPTIMEMGEASAAARVAWAHALCVCFKQH